jgi:hypothetical protein
VEAVIEEGTVLYRVDKEVVICRYELRGSLDVIEQWEYIEKRS